MRAADLKPRRPVYLDEVRGPAEALALRRIRNGVRAYMTGDTSEVGFLRQAAWWLRYRGWRREGRMFAYLARPGRGMAPIGYGLLRLERGRRWWVTGAIVEGARGYGYGRALFTELTVMAVARGGAAWLEVREDNARAWRLYRSLGYAVQDRVGDRTAPGVLVMVYR